MKKIIVSFFIFCFLIVFGQNSPAKAALPLELKESIDKKVKEILEINSQIQETQKKIEGTQEESKTLKKEINKVDGQLNQIRLGIKSSEIMIEKFGLEIESLQYTIGDIEEKTDIQKKAIAETLRELQEKDNDTLLVIFLKNKSLAESVNEAENLSELNANLSEEIQGLKELKLQLTENLSEVSNKKFGKEIENSNLKNKKLISEEIKKDKQVLLEETKNQEKVYQKNLSELEKKQAEIASELEGIEEELRLKIDPTLIPSARPGVLGIPVEISRLTQGYGATTFAKYGYRGKWHNGIDFGGPIGTPILAAEKGKVINVDNQDNYCYRGAYGKYIAIQHENNLTTLYAHLSLYNVKIGDQVQKGQFIGYIGKTGYATGPHLHFTVYSTATFNLKPSRSCGPTPTGGDINPLNYLAI
ncbi:hypothetical protein A2999_00210 [Candidatus Wolfebacteria bacterium RIFCSPLOWO2_01_FULL_38_11]|uniref:M23ase beta-sheet core domain-containing protein n=1 Tax=Candidatus Wolfebacteria bacterium RIFCSPLOWO2_01_FULL_38_11 TaxID=1802556 RepID=A0A1F8DPN8_9BACT|nr:MAG: hypothetical protein A2999_00210 [Candidatus Wolfebacteria bacterium RIFCSPLOWO2_01_FULL_38_11]